MLNYNLSIKFKKGKKSVEILKKTTILGGGGLKG